MQRHGVQAGLAKDRATGQLQQPGFVKRGWCLPIRPEARSQQLAALNITPMFLKASSFRRLCTHTPDETNTQVSGALRLPGRHHERRQCHRADMPRP